MLATRFMTIVCSVGVLPSVAGNVAAQETIADKVITELNDRIAAWRVTEGNKSYRVLFDAALKLTDAPSRSGGADEGFNLTTIHSRMADWQATSDWAETNRHMREAILECRDKLRIGLPYGDGIDEKYLQKGMFAQPAVEGDLRRQDFAYLDVMDTITAYAAAECYRLFEARESEMAIDLAVAQVYVLNQLIKRDFVVEELHAMHLLSGFLESLRDMMYLYSDRISIEQFASDKYTGDDGQTRKGIAFELPWLRIDLLEMPMGDYIAAQGMVDDVFVADEADPDRFAETYARVQASDKPLTQFGAAKRWRIVARVHGSKLATQDHLRLVFEDWQRRWGVRAWDPILDRLDPLYDRINPVRYAAVTYSMRDISDIFLARRQLRAAVSGTALAAALQAYAKRFGNYPDDLEKVYATYVRKRTDLDPFDKDEGGFGYRFISDDRPLGIKTEEYAGEFITVTGPLLWAKGSDFDSDRGQTHSDDGAIGDIVFWPPLRTLAREQGIDE